ncbi:hypothetical protein V8E52_011099 [Russula decolorans]|jgi:hypothetical protein
MDIDSAKVQMRTPEQQAESAQLRKEGKCFKCQKTGHLKRDCPEWPKKADKPPPYPSKARSTALDPVIKTKGETLDIKGLVQSMSSLDDDKKDELFDLLLAGSKDF